MISRDGLYERLADVEYVLIGETHDNTDQHRVQARIVGYLAGLHESGSVSFEMIDDVQEKYLHDRPIPSAQDLIALLQHTNSGWDYNVYYRDLFETVVRGGFKILPANIERDHLVELMQDPAAGLPAGIEQLLDSNPLTPQSTNILRQEIVDSHCGMITTEQAGPMVRGQRIRDAAMAGSLLNSTAGLKILIAGNGHVRTDLGVPTYIHSPGSMLVSIGLQEVDDGLNKPADYAGDWGSDVLPFDYVWFTARADRVDPCIEFIKAHDNKP